MAMKMQSIFSLFPMFYNILFEHTNTYQKRTKQKAKKEQEKEERKESNIKKRKKNKEQEKKERKNMLFFASFFC